MRRGLSLGRAGGWHSCDIDAPSLWQILTLFIIYVFGCATVFVAYLMAACDLYLFTFLYFVTFAFAVPRKVVSPLTFFYIYYGLWFVVAPWFAERYQGGVMDAVQYDLAFALAYVTFGVGVVAMIVGERWAKKSVKTSQGIGYAIGVRDFLILLSFFYFLSTVLVVLIVLNSGGFGVWVSNPGDAFLNRAGSGHFVILSHFSSMLLALFTGWYASSKGKRTPIALFLIWLVITSPVHGSKFQIVLLIVLSVLPWIRYIPFFSKGSMVLGFGFIFVLFLGLYFRNMSWIDIESIVPYTLNYFTALENLAVSLRDFDSAFMTTFFLPFNKFLTPFGLSDASLYYDMNHYLTDIYFPSAWEIRATEQWPVETDLYLNFYFFGGLPVIAFYLGFIGYLYGLACRKNSVGAWFAAVVMILFMISHLRGSLINHTDFYMYPFIFLMYIGFSKFNFKVKRDYL